jgi:hypothetical protein
LLVLAGCSHSPVRPVDPAMTRLDSAISVVATARSALLSATDAIESTATQLDATDALCAAGKGRAARTSYEKALPVLRLARQGLGRFGQLVTTYSRSLDGLRDASRSSLVRAAERGALDAAVRDGRTEAAAFEGFRGSLSALWPAYGRLSGQEDTWTTHAVAGWYRSAQEAAAAYDVLVRPSRTELQAARSRLAAAALALDAPTTVQSATLRLADQALDRLRHG